MSILHARSGQIVDVRPIGGALRDNIAHIGHFHTGGVPGRRDIDDTQELNYPAICRAIVESGFDGYVAHEFIPKKDKLETLARCVKLCEV